MQDFLLSLNLSARSKNNYRTAISNLFSHARLRAHVPKDFDPLCDLPWAKEVEAEVEVYSPDELKRLFECARQEMLGYLAIAAFAGLRNFRERIAADHKEILLRDDRITIRLVYEL